MSGLTIARLLLRRKNQRLLRDCVYYKLSKCKYKICGMPYDNGQRAIETDSIIRCKYALIIYSESEKM
jgi:hypothetical protein